MPTLHAMRPSFQGLMQTRKQNSLISLPKVCIKLLHFIPSQSLVASSSCLLAAVSHHKIQPFPLSLSTPTHTHHRYTSAELIYRHLCTSFGFASRRIASIALPHRQTHLTTVTRLSFHIRSIPRKLTPSKLSCKAIRRTSGGLTLPSLLTLKV